MKAKHTKTLQAIFAKPTTATLEWARIETLFIALDCHVIEGRALVYVSSSMAGLRRSIVHILPKKLSLTKLNKPATF